jgi:polysaccharide export outer membrane protein
MTRRVAPYVVVICVASLGTGAVSHALVAPGQAQAPGQPPASPPAAARQAPAPIRPAELGSYRIGPEDVLDISVWKNAELTRTVPVRPDGRISLPLLNDIQAANLTPMELRDNLAKRFAEYVAGDPEVSVIVREIHSIKVSVVGSVKTPGRYELKSQATVLEALALAGGLTDFAKRDRIVIFRRSGKSWVELPFNYAKIVSDWDERQNIPLEPGDIIVIP